MSKRSNLFSEVSNLSPSEGRRTAAEAPPQVGAKARAIKQFVAELRPGDGIDPRDEAKQRRRDLGDVRPGRAHGLHKQEQLLSQVQEAVSSALQCAAAPILSELTVREVVRQGGAMVVVVEPQNPDQPVDVQAASEALDEASSLLSREVAATITRKEVPTLRFLVLPAGAQKVEE